MQRAPVPTSRPVRAAPQGLPGAPLRGQASTDSTSAAAGSLWPSVVSERGRSAGGLRFTPPERHAREQRAWGQLAACTAGEQCDGPALQALRQTHNAQRAAPGLEPLALHREVTRDPVTPGSDMRRRRESMGLSLTRLACIVHVAPSTVSRWETGLRRPHPQDLNRIANALGCATQTVAEWFRPLPPLGSETLPTARSLRIVRERRGLSRRELATAVGVSAATVAHWECDRRALPLTRVAVLAAALTIEPARLVDMLTTTRPRDTTVTPLFAQMRRKAGMTQRQVAQALGVSYGAVSAWERGIRKPTWPQLRRLSQLYRLGVDELARTLGLTVPTSFARQTPGGPELAVLLRDARVWRGEGLGEVAARVGVHWTTLRRWETGGSVPNAVRRVRLEAELGLPAGRLPARSRR